MTTVFWALPHTSMLRRLSDAEPVKPKKIPARGYCTSVRTAHKTILTDQEVLLARARYELDNGWTDRMLATHFMVREDYMRKLLQYEIRGKVCFSLQVKKPPLGGGS